ncbi:hypothetical protein KMW28_24940 [Flammeovirga yaeyamensis]|uniref:Uncharacterized protein n=1 Tax=Flammeovirga yaeyamensis TaxID=367791 RepID=A0AAX1N9D1_9BACT|nr:MULTISPECIES: hypothetical protein [Flammeovirga]MBB3699463.1 hypothetical protein [Flammeovirga yaeyamensis]NMF35280.1 hypothetical protein [Flammeovirga yaeyamensis]QJD09383.1 hypothetical protein MY04_05610 [Flammeovirga sp. MY04]QWG04140.1 hypothetical protein KMW28_24940 [Flammeovirga yaeyamensis]
MKSTSCDSRKLLSEKLDSSGAKFSRAQWDMLLENDAPRIVSTINYYNYEN